MHEPDDELEAELRRLAADREPVPAELVQAALDAFGWRDIDAELERFDQQRHREHPNRLGGVALAGAPAAVREYLDEYLATGANYFVCSFQWGDLTHEQAVRSIELFATDVMPRYVTTRAPSAPG